MSINSEECKLINLDEKEVTKIINGFERYMKRAKKLNLYVFGGSSLSLRHKDFKESGDLVIANCESTNVDGGCGAEAVCEDGLIRGEH